MTIVERPDTTATEAATAGATDETPWGLASTMRVRKRDGDARTGRRQQDRARRRAGRRGLDRVDLMRVATRTISGLHDGATTMDLDELSIRTAAALVSEEPNYSRLAARLLATFIDKEVANQNIHSFSQSIAAGHDAGLIADDTAALVANHSYKLNDAIDTSSDYLFEYFGLRTVYDRYLLRHPERRLVIETPQYWFMRVACGLSSTADEAIEFYRLISSLDYLPATPTLFNAGTTHPQLSSCYLLDSPSDTLDAIYDRYKDVARLSKFAGGIGLAFHRVRSRGSLIRGTNGLSNGIVPWLKTLDSSVSAVNQGGKRKGAACVYLETWHADIEEFLELKDNVGDEARRTHNLNLANWVPDLFMERVEKDWTWSLFDPKKVPHLTDLFGAEFERAYVEAESQKLYERQVPARQLYARMMRTLAQTGNGWMTFKDPANARCNQTTDAVVDGPDGQPVHPRVVHLSNLCTEILEVTNDAETAVCNLGSINLGHFVVVDPDTGAAEFDFERLGDVARTAVHYLDRVIDINYYPTDEAGASNARWRPVGLGVMGLQDVFFRMRLPFDSPEARDLSRRIAEEIYFNALSASCDLAAVAGPHAAFAETRLAGGDVPVRPRRPSSRPTPSAGRRCASASPSTACATRCSSPSPRRRRSPRSPAPTSASSRRCPTCSSARRCRASSCRSTRTSCATCRSAGCGPTRCATRSSGPRARCRGSRPSPTTSRRCTARPGSCRCARSSTWPPSAARSSTRASRSTCSSSRRRSASSRRCTCTPGSRASRRRTTCARARPRASPRRRRTARRRRRTRHPSPACRRSRPSRPPSR